MTNDLQTYDFVVMVGGREATTAASCGKSVALVDSHQEIGGAGINTGTVPSKTLRETALALSGLKSRNLYGVDLSLRREVTVADFLHHEEHVHPDLFPFGHGEIYDSDTILKLGRIPKTLAVVGAGVIGAEYGCTFRALGA